MSNTSLLHPAIKSVFAIHPVDLNDLRESDKIIVLLGRTGAGKSNFIQNLASADLKITSFGGNRGTNDLTLYRIHDHPTWNDHIVLADTPGFQDRTLSEYGSIKVIRKWIEDSKAPRLHALVCVDRITDAFKGSDKQCWDLLMNLCGRDSAIRACLVTTAWDLVQTVSLSGRAEKRRMQLQAHWEPYLEKGLQPFDFQNTPESANSILMAVLGPRDRSIGPKYNHLKNIQFVLENMKISLVKRPVQKYIFCLLEERFKTIVQDLAEAEKQLSNPPTSRQRTELETLREAKKRLQSEIQEFTAASSFLSKAIKWFIGFWSQPDPQVPPEGDQPISGDIPDKPNTPDAPDTIPPPYEPITTIPAEPTPPIAGRPDPHNLADVMKWYIQRREGGRVEAHRDIVLIILGSTGTGKSSIIESCVALTGGTPVAGPVQMGHNLDAGTKDVEVHTIYIPETGGRLVLVDTPGFDDPSRPDSQILEEIAKYLEQTYRKKEFLDGVIYPHRITDIRFDSGAASTLHIFKKVYGDDEFDKIAFVTTMWNDIPLSRLPQCVKQERELRDGAWGAFFDRNDAPLLARYDSSDEARRDSVQKIISGLLLNTKGGNLKLQLQRELVDKRLKLPLTRAGKAAFTLRDTARYYLTHFAS